MSGRVRILSQNTDSSAISVCYVAEGEGFEPSIRFPVYTLSRRAPSTTRPPLRIAGMPCDSVRRHLGDLETREDTRQLIRAHVVGVEVRSAELAITLDADVRGVTAPNHGAGQRLGSDGESSPIN